MISRDLKDLLKAGLLVNEPNTRKRYKITDKGLEFLEIVEKMNELITTSE